MPSHWRATAFEEKKSMSQIDIDVRDVTKRFGDVVAVDNVSFNIEKGEFFALLGPSGCGKTTILRMISGFETPTEGDIYIGGEVMTHVPAYHRPTNLVFQQLSLFPHMSVFKNIGFGLEMKRTPTEKIKKAVNEVLELVELGGFAERRIHQLSGGQQQRVAIARALVNHPTVLLLDEPLGALDLKLRNQMQLELKRIQREVGTTFIYVTHDQGEALTMSNRIAVMNNGVIEQIGESDNIYENPQTVFVANFIGETNLIEGRISAVDAIKAVITSKDLAISVGLQKDLNKGQNAFISVRPEKIRIGEQLSGLENIYSGVVEEAIYHGELTIYTISIEDRHRLTVKVQNVDMKGSYAPGTRLQVGWRIENGIVITGNGNS
jgi:spermidine/putrescine transport system ATP-binding protein